MIGGNLAGAVNGVFVAARAPWRWWRWAGIAVTALLLTAAAFAASNTGPVFSAKWTAGGRLVTFQDRRQLWLMNADGTQRRPVASYSEAALGAASVSPNGRIVAISTVTGAGADRGLLVLKRVAENRTIRRFGLGNEQTDRLGEPVWAPGQGALALEVFLHGEPKRSHIFVADLNRGARSLSNISSRDDELPAWSPNGRQIAFLSCPKGRDACELAVMGSDGSHRRAALRNIAPFAPERNRRPAWAPNGRAIALVLRDERRAPDTPQSYQIHIVRPDTSKSQLVATPAVGAAFSGIGIAWSPDGRRLAFSDPRGVWAVDLATRRKRLITSLGANRKYGVGAVSWAPSRRILFTHGGDIYATLPGRKPVRILR